MGKKAGKKAGRRGKRVRRSAEDLGAVSGNIVAALRAEPGQSISQIAARVNVDKKDLVGPLSQLLATKKIKKTGDRRGTKYFAR